MDPERFRILVAEVKKQGISSNKVAAIRTSIKSEGRISSEQVADLVKLISFDADQLEVAEMAYEYSTNRGAYAIVVGKAFKYGSTREKLSEFLAGS